MIFYFLLIGFCLSQKATRLPIMGWNTWCTDNYLPCLDDYCSQTEIEDVAQTMATNGMKELGYSWILLDDCWASTTRSPTGEMQADSSRFPNGTLSDLAQFVHNLGFKLGLYTDVGPKTCRDGRTGSWPYYAQDVKTWASWGVDFVKMDWCGHPSGLTAQQLYTNMSQAMSKSGHSFTFSLCEWGLFDVWTWAPKIANMWRVGPDHLPLWWTPTTSQDPGQGQGTANIIQHMAGKSQYAGPYGFNDPDFLEPGFFWFSEEDQKTEFSFWCLFAAPLVVATDIRYLHDKKQILNSEAIAVNQDSLVIAGDLRVNNTDGGQVWSRPLSDGTWAAILYNSNIWFDSATPVLTFNSQNLPGWNNSIKKAKIRDLWDHKDLGIFTGTWSAGSLRPHVSKFVKVTPIQ